MKENIQEIPAIAGGTPVRDTKISYGHQYLDEADYQAVLDVLKNGPLTCGPKIGELEDKLCRITGARHAVSVSNGTAALHIACLAAGVGEGDEVITLLPLPHPQTVRCTAGPNRYLRISTKKPMKSIPPVWKAVSQKKQRLWWLWTIPDSPRI